MLYEVITDGQPFSLLGEVIAAPVVEIRGVQGEVVVKSNIDDLKAAWQAPLKEL